MTEEENNKYKEKVKQLSATVNGLKEELKVQRKESRKKHFNALRSSIQLLLYHIRKRKPLIMKQKRGYMPARWYQKLNFFEIVFGLSTVVLGIIGTNLIINQNKRLDQQTYLQEADRRSALVFLMGNIFDEVSSELKADSNKDKRLSPQLIGRIVALSHSLIPYKSLMGGELSRHDYSIERGQLLITLVNSGINKNTLKEIYAKSNFTHSYLADINLSKAYLYGINLTTSMMRDVNLSGADLSYSTFKNVNLIGADLRETVLDHAYIYKSELYDAKFDSTDFTSVILDSVWINKRANIDKSVFTRNYIDTSFFGNVLKDTVYTFFEKE